MCSKISYVVLSVPIERRGVIILYTLAAGSPSSYGYSGGAGVDRQEPLKTVELAKSASTASVLAEPSGIVWILL